MTKKQLKEAYTNWNREITKLGERKKARVAQWIAQQPRSCRVRVQVPSSALLGKETINIPDTRRNTP